MCDDSCNKVEQVTEPLLGWAAAALALGSISQHA